MDNEKKQVTYNSSITGETQVTFDIQQYMNNRAMFIGLMCNEDGRSEEHTSELQSQIASRMPSSA